MNTPWKVGERCGALSIVDSKGFLLGDFSRCLLTRKQLEEVVAAMAAAPQLLGACKHALRYLEARGAYDTAEVAAPIRAAVEKAEGK